MDKCLECGNDVEKEWYIPTSHGGILPFCSEECGNNHMPKLIKQGGYVMGKEVPGHPNEMIIDTGTNES